LRQKNLVYSERNGNTGLHRFDTVKISSNTYDLLSILYYVRTLKFNNLKKNEKLPVYLMLDRKYKKLYYTYKGKEILQKNKIGKYKTIKLEIETVPGLEFDEGQIITLWITDDKNHIPVWIESPISVGAVKVRLAGYKNLKYPLSAKIK